MPSSIVDEVFGRPDARARRRWAISVVAIAAPGTILLVLWSAAHPSGSRRSAPSPLPPPEITIEESPRPPAVALVSGPAVALVSPPSARGRAARSRTPARAAAVVTAGGPAGGPSFTFASGVAATFTGGLTAGGGAVVGTTSGSLGRPVRLTEDGWSCPWPAEAEARDINEETVLLRVAVQPDGRVDAVDIVAQPGHGFGAAALACARQARFTPARDALGAPTFAWSPPIRVRFVR